MGTGKGVQTAVADSSGVPAPGEAVAGHGRPDSPTERQIPWWAYAKIFDALNPPAGLRRKIRRAKFPSGATQKNLTLQIPLRASEEKIEAPNFPAELRKEFQRAKFARGGPNSVT